MAVDIAKLDEAKRIFREHNVLIEVLNTGIQIAVEGSTGYIDYYPGNGTWVSRADGLKGFGIRTLLHELGQQFKYEVSRIHKE